MADREARIRLQLQAGSFIGGLQQLANKAAHVGAQVASAFKGPALDGLTAFRASLSGSVRELSGMAQTAAGLAGGFSAATGAQGALDLAERYRKLAFEIEMASGETVDYTRILSDVEAASDRANRTTAEMTDGFEAIRDKTGDIEVATRMLEVLGDTLNSSKEPAAELGAAIGSLSKKWGIKEPEEMQQALLAVFETAASGKFKFAELSEDLDELGSIAESAGMHGLSGFRKALGLAAGVAPHVNRSLSEVMTGLDQLTEKLRQQNVVQGLADVGGKAGKEFWDEFLAHGDATERMRVLLERAASKGKLGELNKVAMEVEFTGREERAAFKVLADPFIEAFAEARASGQKTKEATKTASSAFDAAVAQLGHTSRTWSDVQAQAATEQQSVGARIRDAQQIWQRAFTDPQTMAAMDDLAQHLPQLAGGFADLMRTVVEHPLGSAAGFMAGRAAAAGLGEFAGSALKKAAQTGWERVGKGIAESAATNTTWGNAGKAIGVAAAAFIGFEVGKQVTNWVADMIDATQKKAFSKDISAFNAQQKALARARHETATTGGITKETRSALEREAESLRDKLEARRPRPMAGAAMPGMAPTISFTEATTIDMNKANFNENARRLEQIERVLNGELRVRVVNTSEAFSSVSGGGEGSNGLPAPADRRPGYAGGGS